MAEEEIERTLNKSDQRDILVEMNGQELSLSLKIMTLQTDEETTIRCELSNPSDLTFLKYASIDKERFYALMKSQNISIPFEAFSEHFFTILDKIRGINSSQPSSLADLFSFVIHFDEEATGSYQLRIIQTSSFITIPILSIPFSSCSNEEIISYLHSIIRSYQEEGVGESSVSYQSLKQQQSTEILQLKQQHEEEMNELQTSFETQLASLRDQIATIEKEKAESLQLQQSQWETHIDSLQTQNTTLNEQLIQITSERDELASTNETLKEQINVIQKQTDELRSSSVLISKKEEDDKLLIEEINASKNRIQELEQENERFTGIEQQLSSLQKELKNCQEELQASQIKNADCEKCISELTETNEFLYNEVEKLKKDCDQYSEEIKVVTHTSKMKDRAISCLNMEINKLKLGASYPSTV